MMKVNDVSTNNNIQSVAGSADVQYDAVGKDIESKILDARKRQKELNSDQEMTAGEKSSIRQEIQREISELERQLRQHQAERKKEQQKEDKSAEERKERLKNVNSDADSGLKSKEASGETKGAMYESGYESAIKQIQVVMNEDARTDGRIRIIEAEEKQDAIGKTGKADKNSRMDDVRRRSRMVEIAQKAMFGDTNKESDRTVGSGKRFYEDDRYKGLYNNKGLLIRDPIVSL